MSKILEKIKGWFYREKIYRNSVRVRRYLFFKTITEIYPRPESLTESLSKSLHRSLSMSLGENLGQSLSKKVEETLQGSLRQTNKDKPAPPKPRWARHEQIYTQLFSKYHSVSPCIPPNPKKELPENCIWVLWLQGEDAAPDIVRICINSIRRHNPGRLVIVLTENNLKEYVDIPPIIRKKLDSGKISYTHFSDILRLLLLTIYGGTWMDATIYQTAPLPDEMVSGNLFMYTNAAWHCAKIPRSAKLIKMFCDSEFVPYHSFSSWYIHAGKNNRYLCLILNMLLAYWQDCDKLIDYYLLHYFGVVALVSDAECCRIFESMPRYRRHTAFLMDNLRAKVSDDEYRELMSLSPIHKITHKYNADIPFEPDMILSRIFRQEEEITKEREKA